MSDKKQDTTAPEGEAKVELTQEQIDELVTNRVNAALAELEEQRSQENGQQVELAQLVEAFGLNTDGAEEQQIEHLNQLAEMVEQQATLRWQQKLAQMQRQNKYTELAQRVTGGTPDAPRGIPAEADTVRDELLKLEPERAKFWGGLMETIVKHGLSDFAELGHGKKVQGTAKLEPEVARQLEQHVEAGGSIDDFFAAAGDILGDRERYDLSKFEEKS